MPRNGIYQIREKDLLFAGNYLDGQVENIKITLRVPKGAQSVDITEYASDILHRMAAEDIASIAEAGEVNVGGIRSAS